MSREIDYRSAGVDLDRGEREKAGFRGLLESTRDERTLSKLGLFGGLYAVPTGVLDPVLVSSTDGVGTKLKVAFLAGIHDTVGRDIVNHCVNDILVQGARPLFFLDYLAIGVLAEGVVHSVVRGVAEGCRENGCVLLGGETAQMPEFYPAGEYDLAGFVVGIVPRDRILDGSAVRAGDVLLGLPSSGLHTNGYTLARKIVFDASGLGVDDPFPGLGATVGSALLRVHRSYLHVLLGELERGSIRAMAHITGGGLPGNLPRSLPTGLGAEIRASSWTVPPLFRALQELGSVRDDEMFRVFNMGVGMVVVVPCAEADLVLARLRGSGEDAWVLGSVVEESGVHFI
ncbi:MAG: phosphoribosylformylglycinamidine cyclo-ligase [Gemmatimonadetes bacterium]|nr:phosphoribosylformylglycinamidine cyclo-ligase [Gemmatimonadota bacterium]